MMHKKDYELIADAIAEAIEKISDRNIPGIYGYSVRKEILVECFSKRLKEDNVGFDEVKFREEISRIVRRKRVFQTMEQVRKV